MRAVPTGPIRAPLSDLDYWLSPFGKRRAVSLQAFWPRWLGACDPRAQESLMDLGGTIVELLRQDWADGLIAAWSPRGRAPLWLTSGQGGLVDMLAERADLIVRTQDLFASGQAYGLQVTLRGAGRKLFGDLYTGFETALVETPDLGGEVAAGRCGPALLPPEPASPGGRLPVPLAGEGAPALN